MYKDIKLIIFMWCFLYISKSWQNCDSFSVMYQRFAGPRCFHLQWGFTALRDVGTLPHHITSHHITPRCHNTAEDSGLDLHDREKRKSRISLCHTAHTHTACRFHLQQLEISLYCVPVLAHFIKSVLKSHDVKNGRKYFPHYKLMLQIHTNAKVIWGNKQIKLTALPVRRRREFFSAN